MAADDDAVAPSRRVEARDEAGKRLGEAVEVLGRGEADLGLDGEGEQALAALLGRTRSEQPRR